jgi:hypothetical protein
VRVTAIPSGAGQLTATLFAQQTAALPSNVFGALTITRAENATVLVNGSPVTLGAAISLPAGTTQITLLVTRQTAGQASTVAFSVTDLCGEWRSFVGGGPSSF